MQHGSVSVRMHLVCCWLLVVLLVVLRLRLSVVMSVCCASSVGCSSIDFAGVFAMFVLASSCRSRRRSLHHYCAILCECLHVCRYLCE